MNTHSSNTLTRLDRRVNRTRRQLREALTALILEKGYDDLTIEEITERADLGRTTFYLHYGGKEELLLECIGTTAQELYDQVNPLISTSMPRTPQMGLTAVSQVFRHAAQNSLLYRIIFKGGAASKVENLIQEFLSEAARPYFEQAYQSDHPSPIPIDVVAHYFSAALLGFLTWWLEADMPYSPDEAASYFTSMFFAGASHLRSDSAGMPHSPTGIQPE